MSERLVHILRYSKTHKVFLGLLNLLLLAISSILCIKLYSTVSGFNIPYIMLLSLLVLTVFLQFILIAYSRYVLKWYAELSDQGITFYDPIKGKLDYYWDTDVISMDSFNLRLEKGPYGSPERMSRTYDNYRISKWLTGHKKIIDSLVTFVSHKKFKHINIDEIVQSRLIQESKDAYYHFLRKNKWNMLYLGFQFSRITTVLLVLYILVFDQFYFNPEIALIICIIVGIQLAIIFQYWNLLSFKSCLIQMLNGIVAILAFSYIMFDNVHFKDEMFFLLWGIVFGCILTLGILGFVYFYRNIVLSLPRKIQLGIFLTCFVILSLYSGAFLKVGNIIYSEHPLVWEKATAEAPLFFIVTPGSDYDYVIFDNKQWGSHHMGLFFLNWREINESTKRIELLTHKGRLGVPWLYKNYHKGKRKKAKVIAFTPANAAYVYIS